MVGDINQSVRGRPNGWGCHTYNIGLPIIHIHDNIGLPNVQV